VAGSRDLAALKTLSVAILAAGGALVFLFTGVGQKPLARCLSGLLGFARVTSAFGDVLSYLRLFALGLASASLAVAFNGMAGRLGESMGGIGLLCVLLVLVIGHGLNFVLGISSAVIHGLRLNVIEFFNWGMTEEGKLFRPLKRKESSVWSR
jgi:V/A-type H+/Na+-transporting ATPase subunit I